VVLESNKGKCKTRVAAKPELKRNVDSCLGNTSTYIAVVVALRGL
jgi:hypothetical protein